MVTQPVSYSYLSNDLTIVTVDPVTGTIDAQAVGSTTITINATFGRLPIPPANITVTVVETDVYLIECENISIKVNQDPIVLAPTLKLNGEAVASGTTYTFTSTHPDIAMVDTNGSITGIKVGNTTILIEAQVGGELVASKTIIVTVTKADVYELTCDDVNIKVNQDPITLVPHLTLNGKVLTDNVSYDYTSLNSTIATVDGSGTVVGIKDGTTTISIDAIINTKIVASLKITVIVDKADVYEITCSDVKTKVGYDPTILSPTLKLNGKEFTVGVSYDYTSLDPSIATVDSNGNVTAVTVGDTTISINAIINTKTVANIIIAVNIGPADVYEISCDNVNIKINQDPVALIPSLTLNGVTFTDGVSYQYICDDLTIATVDTNGNVTGLKVGNTTITVSAIINSKTVATKIITVNVAEADVYVVSCSDVNTKVGSDPVILSPALTLNGDLISEGVSYNYTSSDNTIATVDATGSVTGIKTGSTNITIKASLTGKDVASTPILVTVGDADVYTITCNDVNTKVGQTPVTLAPKLLLNGDEVATGASYGYASNDLTVATVDTNGKITAIKAGTTSITISAIVSGKTVTSKNVNVTVIDATKVLVDADVKNVTQTLTDDKIIKISTTVTPSGVSQPIVLTANNDSTLTDIVFLDNKDGSGSLTVKKGGSLTTLQTITVTATCDGATSSVNIAVSPLTNDEKLDYVLVGGITYDVKAKPNTTISGAFTIPTTYSGKPVAGVAANGFKLQTQIESIVIPTSITKIGLSAFNGCSKLTAVTITNNVTSIGTYAFANCSHLADVSIGAKVATISAGAFDSCTLKTIKVDSANTKYALATNVGVNGKAVVDKTIGILNPDCSGSFGSLICGDIILPTTVTKIKTYAFTNCYGLTSISMSNMIDTIDTNAFSGCVGLSTVVIPNSVQTVGLYAFTTCTNLTTVTIGTGIKTILEGAFSSCPLLTKLTVNAITPPALGINVFVDASANFKIYVPVGSVSNYQTALNWSVYASKILPI